MKSPAPRHDETGDFTPVPLAAVDSVTVDSIDIISPSAHSAPSNGSSFLTDSPTVDSVDLAGGSASAPRSDTNANTVDSKKDPTSPEMAALSLPLIPGFAIEAEIGRGGMGVVFKARHRNLNRDVAVKMLIAEKFPSSEDLIRFRLEAEVAARVRHPNVVQVYESGSYNRSPYLVLEWVEGGTLSDALRGGRKFTPEASARMAALLARAVHHAHSNGVVHRDLKPANVLLARTDALSTKQHSSSGHGSQGRISAVLIEVGNEPRTVIPKVTDFGLAKLTVGDMGITETGRVMGTPEYMSPEQASGRTKEVGPAADVHALGVMLYQMLLGQTPFAAESKIAVIKKVVDFEVQGGALVAAGISKDLQTICLKCLRKKPEDRYETAGDLAADLEASIEGRPILARPVGQLERLWKLARRNPAVSTLSAVAVTLFLVGFAGVTWQWRRAEFQKGLAIAAEADAARHARTTDAVNTFLIADMLANATPEKAQGRAITVAEVLDEAALRIRGAFADEPQIKAGIQYALGRSYRSLGKPARSVEFLEQARDTRLKELGANHADTLKAGMELALSLDDDGKQAEAGALFAETAKLAEAALGADNRTTLEIRAAYGLSLHLHGKSDEGLAILRDVLAKREKADGPSAPATLKLKNDLGLVEYERRDYPEAEKLTRAAYDGRLKTFGARHPVTLESQNNLGTIGEASGELETAKKLFLDVLSASRAVRGPNHIDTLSAINNLGRIQYDDGKMELAAELYREAYETGAASLGEANPVVLRFRHNLATAYAGQREWEKAEAELEAVAAARAKILVPDHPDRLQSEHDLGVVKAELGKANPKDAADAAKARQAKLREGLALLKDAFEGRQRALGATHPDTLTSAACWAETGLRAKLPAGDLAKVREAIASVWKKADGSKGENLDAARVAAMLGAYELTAALAAPPPADAAQLRVSAREHAAAALRIRDKFLDAKPATLLTYCTACANFMMQTDRQTEPKAPKLTDGIKAALPPALRAVEVAHRLPPDSDAAKLPAKTNKAKLMDACLLAGQIALDTGANASALKPCQDLYDLRCRTSPGTPEEGTAANLLGVCLCRMGRYAEAEPLLLHGYELISKPDRRAAAKADLAELYAAWGKPDQAEKWRGADSENKLR